MKYDPVNLAELKVQIAATRRVPEVLTVWPEALEEVDLVMDPRFGLKFRAGSLRALYVFDFLGRTEPSKVQEMVNSFCKALAPGGELYIIEPDFDYITRAAVGGDIGPDQFAADFSRKSYFALQNMAEILAKAGLPRENQVIWNDPSGLKFIRHHFEVIVSGKKANG